MARCSFRSRIPTGTEAVRLPAMATHVGLLSRSACTKNDRTGAWFRHAKRAALHAQLAKLIRRPIDPDQIDRLAAHFLRGCALRVSLCIVVLTKFGLAFARDFWVCAVLPRGRAR